MKKLVYVLLVAIPSPATATEAISLANACGTPVHHAFVEVGRHEPPQVFTPDKVDGRWEFNDLTETTEPLTALCFRTTDRASLFRVPLPSGLSRCHFENGALTCSGAGSVSSIPTATGDDASCSSAGNQRAINECYGARYQEANAALQKAYDSLRSKLEPTAANRLRDTQRAWAAYKDGWCAFQSASVENGSMYPAIAAQCLTQLTNEQLALLIHQNTCTEDVDCAPKRN